MERIVRALDASRFAAVMAVPEGTPLASRWRASGLDVAGTPPVTRLSDPMQARAAIAGIAGIVRDYRIDLIHTHGVAAQLHGGLAGRRTRRPVISHAQDIFDASWTRNGLVHRLAWMMPRTVTIAASQAIAASLGRHGAQGLCEVIANPVEIDLVAPARSERPLVLWCGRLQRWKGCHLFLEAARLVRDAHPSARFAVVGGSVFGLDAEYPDELRRYTQQLGLAESVEFTGHVDDPRPWMRAADVFVHSSVRPEPFGLVMAEAMVQERSVVAFDHGGASEIVATGETGLLTPPGDTAGLASAISALLADPARRERMGRLARRRAVDRYGSSQIARRVEAVYDRAIVPRAAA